MSTTRITTSHPRARSPRAARTTAVAMLAALCALGVTLASAPAAHAGLVYSNVGSFDEGHEHPHPQGVAVNQSNGHVYVANYTEGIYQFESLGAPVPPEPFAGGFILTAGVAVDPENHNVYGYERENQEVNTFEPPSGTRIRHFTVTGKAFVQIASDAAGDIFYPNQAENTVQEFAPEAKEGEATPILTIAPTEEQLLVNSALALVEPKGVAVNSTHGKVYVVDSGNGGATPPGRVQVFNASSGAYESTLDEGGSQDVAVDAVTGEVFVLNVNSEGSCVPLSKPCYRIRIYHTGETTPFAEFGEGTIGGAGYQLSDRLAVDDSTGDVYVSDVENEKVWIFEPLLAPSAITEPATGVSGTETTLNGTVNPERTQTSYHFEYGTSTAYVKNVPVPDAALGKGVTSIKVSQLVSGLEGSTPYHFRVVASTSGGVVIDGADEVFTTEAIAPVVDRESVTGITRTDAQLEALINPENQETTYHFEYATEHTGEQLNGAIPVAGGSIPAAGIAQTVGPVDIGGGLTPGETYYYRVVTEDATGTTPGPVQSFTTIGKPVLSTGEAIGLTRTSATLQGTVDPVGAESAYHYVYIEQPGYEAALAQGGSDPYADGQSTLAVKVAAGYATEVAGPVAIGGLLPGTTYHYALVANNEVGETIGADETFTTGSPTPPLVSTGTASGVSINAASISATIETGGSPAIYGFEIGTEAGIYGVATGLGSVGAGLTETVTLSLQNLQPGVTYHYRIEASNVDGIAKGADQSFTTPGLPVLLTSLIAEPLIATPAIAFPSGSQENTGSGGETKPLTKAQKLKAALKTCKRDKAKAKRKSCENTAHRRYSSKPKPEAKK